MIDRSIFGDAQGRVPDQPKSAEARTQKACPWQGLFGAKLLSDDVRVAQPVIGLDKLEQSLS